MKLPANIEYACKAAIELAMRYSSDIPVQLSTISESQNIPKKFLIQILSRLKNGGIIKTSRGASGGYYLSKAPSRLTLADIIGSVDSNLLDNGRSVQHHAGSGGASGLIYGVWNEINKEVAGRLAGLDLGKLGEVIKKEQMTYHI